GVGVVLGLGVGLVVVFPVYAVASDDRIVGGRAGDDRSVVDPRLIQRSGPAGRHAAVGPDDAGQEFGVSTVLVGVVGDSAHGVGRRGDEAVAMGEHSVPVDPVPLVVDQVVGVEFACGNHIVVQI